MSLEENTATHYSILAWRIPMDRRAWWATVHGVAKSWTQWSMSMLLFFDFPGGSDGKASAYNAGHWV